MNILECPVEMQRHYIVCALTAIRSHCAIFDQYIKHGKLRANYRLTFEFNGVTEVIEDVCEIDLAKIDVSEPNGAIPFSLLMFRMEQVVMNGIGTSIGHMFTNEDGSPMQVLVDHYPNIAKAVQ